MANPTDNSKTIKVFPNYEQRQTAAQTLARKVLPDMKAVEHSGDVTISHEDRLRALDD